ncbi:hypothetical protein AAC387_Pa05g1695 [Persea americana]
MADEFELLEVEILEGRIRRLESSNQLLQENGRLQTTTNSRLLEENDRLRSTFSDVKQELDSLKIDQKKALASLKNENRLLKSQLDDAARDRKTLSCDLDAKSDEIERLLSEIEDLEKNSEEDRKEMKKMRKEEEALATAMETLEARIDRMMEENTAVILAVLQAQSELEADLEKQTEIIRGFFERTVEMVRRTVEMVERGAVYGWDAATEEAIGGGMDSTVEMMLRSIAVELAGLKRVLRRNLAPLGRGIFRVDEAEAEAEAGTV